MHLFEIIKTLETLSSIFLHNSHQFIIVYEHVLRDLAKDKKQKFQGIPKEFIAKNVWKISLRIKIPTNDYYYFFICIY